MPTTKALIKSFVLLAILLAVNIFFGQIAGQVHDQYALVFGLGSELIDFALWVFGGILLAALVTGLFVALVRPFWMIIVGLALGATALTITWGAGPISLLIGLAYFLLALFYARAAVSGLNNCLNFSVRPIATSQKTLLLALVIIISASFALGYRADVKQRGFIIPLTYRESVMKMIIPLLKSQVEKQFKVGPRESALAVREIERQVETFWLKAEKTLQPYAEYLPLGPGLMIFFLLETFLGLVAWIVPSLLRLLFPLLNLVGLTRVVVETKEARQVTLG